MLHVSNILLKDLLVSRLKISICWNKRWLWVIASVSDFKGILYVWVALFSFLQIHWSVHASRETDFNSSLSEQGYFTGNNRIWLLLTFPHNYFWHFSFNVFPYGLRRQRYSMIHFACNLHEQVRLQYNSALKLEKL